MTVPPLDTLIGRQLKDPYGRYIGVIAGISTDNSGNIQSIGVDTGCDGFKKIDGERIFFEDDSPLMISDWRLEADNFLKTSVLAEKKMQALEELYNEGEISKDVYQQLADSHKAQFDIDSINSDDTVANLNDKVEAIKCDNGVVEGFLGNLKLQHRIGEIDDSTYQVACEYMGTILQRNEKEVADISAVLNDIMPPEPSPDVEEAETEEPTSEVTEEPIPEAADEPVAEVTEEPAVSEESAQVEEQASEEPSEEPSPAEVIATAQSDAPMPDEQTVSADADADTGAPESEAPDTVSMEETPISSDVVDTPSLTEEISGDTAGQAVEESSIDTPATPDITTADEAISDTSVEQEPIDDTTPEEVTEVSDHMLVEETGSTADAVTTSDDDEDDADSTEIKDSVSFEEGSTDTTETTSSDEVSDTPDSDEDSEEDEIVYTTQ